MKHLTKISLILLLLSTIFVGCEKIKGIADVQFDADFETELDVNVQPTFLKAGVNGAFNVSETIDPLSNSDMATYADLIKEIEIVEASAEVLAISTPVVLQSATLSATSAGYNAAVWTFTNKALAVGTVLTLDNENSQFDNLQSILNSKNVFTVTLQGSTDVDEATFTVLVKYKTRITANPL